MSIIAAMRTFKFNQGTGRVRGSWRGKLEGKVGARKGYSVTGYQPINLQIYQSKKALGPEEFQTIQDPGNNRTA